MDTASGQFMQSSGDFPDGSSEPVDGSDDEVIALPKPAQAFGPARSVATGTPGCGVAAHPIGNDAGGRDDIVLLIDRLLPSGNPEIDGNTHLHVQQVLSDNPSRLRHSTWEWPAALPDQTSGSNICVIVRRAVLTGNGTLSSAALLTEIGSGHYRAELAAGTYL